MDYNLLRFEFWKFSSREDYYDTDFEVDNQFSYFDVNSNRYVKVNSEKIISDMERAYGDANYILANFKKYKSLSSCESTEFPEKFKKDCDLFFDILSRGSDLNCEKKVRFMLNGLIILHEYDYLVKILERHKELFCTSNGFHKSSKNIYDVCDIIVRAGDEALCRAKNPFLAEKIYDKLLSLGTDKERIRYMDFCNAVRSINGSSNYVSESVQKYISKDIGTDVVECFFTLKKSVFERNSLKITEDTDVFFDKIREYSEEITYGNRWLSLMYFWIWRNCLVDVLCSLYSDNNYVNLVKEIRFDFSYFALCNDYNQIDIVAFARKFDILRITLIELVKIGWLVRQSDIIKESLRLRETELKEFACYMSVNSFEHMLPQNHAEDVDNVGKLAVMHVSYMNDPSEGHMLQKFLLNKKSLLIDKSQRENLSLPYIFMKSFTSMVDYLPMWKTYSDDAKGFCLVFGVSDVIKDELYRVCYLSVRPSKGIRKEYNEGIDCAKIRICLNELRKVIFGTGKKSDLFKLYDYILSDVCFLFKDDSYAYEKEVRYLKRYDNVDDDFCFSSNLAGLDRSYSKMFVYMQYKMRLKEVIFGPKFEDKYLRIPYYQHQIDLMSKHLEVFSPKLSASNIEFR